MWQHILASVQAHWIPITVVIALFGGLWAVVIVNDRDAKERIKREQAGIDWERLARYDAMVSLRHRGAPQPK